MTGYLHRINHRSRLNTIQLLRAVAVLMVVHCHTIDLQPAHTKSGNSFQYQFFYLPNFGAAGVDIFFVISGFIITVISAHYARSNKVYDFFIKRLIRVIPLYWLVSLLFIVISLVFGRHNPIGHIVMSFVIFPFFNDPHFDIPVLIQGWTISFELLFYMVITAAMKCSRRWYILITVLFFSACILFNYNHTRTAHNGLVNFFGNGIMLEFLMGMVTGIVFLSPVSVKPIVTNIFMFAGIAGLLMSVFTGYGIISQGIGIVLGTSSLERVLIWGVPSALLVAGVALKEKSHPVFIHSFWIAIGNASFSIYLTHLIILPSLYVKCWVRWGVTDMIQPDLLLFISLALAIMGGFLFYKMVEIPVLRKLNAYVTKPAGISPAPVMK